MPYASVARKRCACQPAYRASPARQCDRDSKGRRPAPSLHAQSCLIEKHLQTPARECRSGRAFVCDAQVSASQQMTLVARVLIRDVMAWSAANLIDGWPMEFLVGTDSSLPCTSIVFRHLRDQ